jgi:hypothetical protein
MRGNGLELSGSGQGQFAGCCECGNGSLNFMKCENSGFIYFSKI